MTEVNESIVGSDVAGYRVEELVGRGGMGEVYRAHDQRLDRNVALKILAAIYAEDDAFRERLERESRIAASLDHPNVVPIYEAGDTDGRLFIAMRFVDGTDLKALLRREGPLEPERATAIARQVADALDAAHERGLVHRDVKPSNVLLDQQGGREHAYLADFGLTQSVSDRGPTDGQLMGTVDYVAPEQIRGDEIDGRADVYALGCLLFEALTGTLPFGGASDVAVVYAHLEQEPPRASDRRSALPVALDEVLGRAMSKDPDDRQATCRALVEEASAALGLDTPEVRSRRRSIAITAIAVALAFAVAVAVAIAVTGGETASAEPAASLVRFDPSSLEVTARLPIAADPLHIAEESGQVWFSAGDALWRVDPGRPEVVKVDATGAIHDLVGYRELMYAARDGEGLLDGIVSPYGAVSGRQNGASLLACSLGADEKLGLWAAGCPNINHLRPGPGKLTVGPDILIPFAQPTTASNARECLCSVTVGVGSVWAVGDGIEPRIWRIDPRGKVTATIDLPVIPRSLVVVGTTGWLTAPLDDVVLKIDLTTNRVVGRVPVGRNPDGILSALGSLWVVNSLDGTVDRLDPRSGARLGTAHVGGHPTEVAAAGGSMWVISDA